MTAHLKSRCGGLLEVRDVLDRHWESISDEETQESIFLFLEKLALWYKTLKERDWGHLGKSRIFIGQ
jgi:hypothetical protein